jgi:HSP90 family molecular chaperone
MRIDETSIETEGFIRDTFEFTIDQARIQDLLTGHTLYNDSRVVLRELVQNSLDAIRLQQHIEP